MNRRLLLSSLVLFTLACDPDTTPAALPTPADAIPEVHVPASALAEFTPDGAALRSPVLRAPLGATRVAALVVLASDDMPSPVLEARGIDGAGHAGAWRALHETWREGDQLVARVELEALARGAQLRVHGGEAITWITWSALVPQPERPALAQPEGDVGASRQALRADLAALGVVAREDWGARATTCSSRNTDKYRIAIHHTVSQPGGDSASRMRGLQAFHMDSRGWCDIGYHFLVSTDGELWEGRPVDLLGAHVGGHNTGNVGISFIGCFHSSGCDGIDTPHVPPEVMITSAASLVAGVADYYAITPSPTTVKGHRDHDGASTACPGDHLHARLDDLRMGGTTASYYGAEYVDQTFPLASQPFELAPGEVSSGYLEMRNTGTEPWRPGETFLGTSEPRDVMSPLEGPSWIAPHRAATVDAEVAPGATGRFTFDVRAPRIPGDYAQYFNLVQEGVAWFGDPGQGGPADDQIQLRITVLDVPPVMDDAGVIEMDGGPVVVADAGLDAGLDSMRETADGGCSCRASAPAGGHRSGMLLFALGALSLLRRRRRQPLRLRRTRRTSTRRSGTR